MKYAEISFLRKKPDIALREETKRKSKPNHIFSIVKMQFVVHTRDGKMKKVRTFNNLVTDGVTIRIRIRKLPPSYEM